MKKFVPYEKLSKKKRRELDAQRRGDWGGMNPVTRRSVDKTAYNRKKTQHWDREDTQAVSFVMRFYMRRGSSVQLHVGDVPAERPAVRRPVEEKAGQIQRQRHALRQDREVQPPSDLIDGCGVFLPLA